MKIALLVPGGVDPSGTRRVIPSVLWLIERLARRHEVHVFALRQEDRTVRYELRGASVHAVGPWPRRLRAATALCLEHARAPFDVLHALWATPQGVLAGALGRVLRRPVVLHLVGGDVRAIPEIGYGLLLTRRGRAWLRIADALAERVLVSSGEMARHARTLGLRVLEVPFGVDLARWPPRAPRPRSREGPARLLHVGSLNSVKDHETLLRAFSVLVSEGVEAELDLVGE
ncbi:MAG: glycosyltransferase, partial [Gemmatimonadetes bacterium]|nr:glycosyltransferase family 4 protein [Gemmatimonadota bacterium]NIR77722.1 glycosyltransferase family 4 protein [Gemmatimonadota bacterium]NIT86266.1 glycosyltransferase family 4 protein [Gemmatimonadota bacterium]NIU30092.1 glycosyltransferase family 4 protein [Gemmatimonadota bacterium]NIU35040.1 glycosyltransferase [Gemmatimonadota bacterium]